ncbi:hypothetical protein A3B87_00555 [Candidatus Kuenenbacteria bacterium RIFCSPHIGHO2_02_FULL_39_13]|uniref:DUF4258 domain-containing protein n=1 Tax=Candidatus Kuenenbacteria bacterium RIFCSPHIGHO2_02_FULL_39_13 TaxID=1798561 RepID=A0A1F6FNZ2_9BACT|nr:MAG: hypothetical protein A3B87_00555 [Candidatus Kuenenbacteria bacterium RIFCSPHIGHO2_02_FULL_39_13]
MAIFTKHALIKLAQRRVPRKLVEITMENPDHVISTFGNRQAAYKYFQKQYLKVVFIESNNQKIVITAHWDKKFKP